jgi:hypothetical protein
MLHTVAEAKPPAANATAATATAASTAAAAAAAATSTPSTATPAAAPAPQPEPEPEPEPQPRLECFFTPGQIVAVQSRTWPGINKPGGTGRITGPAVRTTADGLEGPAGLATYAVKYLLGGRETAIPWHYLWDASETASAEKRPERKVGPAVLPYASDDEDDAAKKGAASSARRDRKRRAPAAKAQQAAAAVAAEHTPGPGPRKLKRTAGTPAASAGSSAPAPAAAATPTAAAASATQAAHSTPRAAPPAATAAATAAPRLPRGAGSVERILKILLVSGSAGAAGARRCLVSWLPTASAKADDQSWEIEARLAASSPEKWKLLLRSYEVEQHRRAAVSATAGPRVGQTIFTVWTEGGEDQWYKASCIGIVDADDASSAGTDDDAASSASPPQPPQLNCRHQLLYEDQTIETVDFGDEVGAVLLLLL